MNPDSQATAAAKRLVRCTLVWLLFGVGGGLLVLWRPTAFQPAVAVAAGLWVLFTGFVLYFFRDPNAETPTATEAIVSPAHGRVDVVDETNEPEFMVGRCRRVSVFLSVLDVHIQNAPVAGRVVCVKHQPGQFLNAMRTESAQCNENQLIGMASAEAPGERVAVRQIAGFIARRVVAWVKEGDAVARGQRLGLIQFGSRCDLYLPLSTEIAVRPGDKVVGGVTIVARRPLSPRSSAHFSPVSEDREADVIE